MDQPTSPDRSADSDFSFLMAVLVAALLAVHTLYRAEAGQTTGFYPLRCGRAEAGQTTGFYPLRCGETALTLGSSGFFLTQALKALNETDPANAAELCAAQWEVLAAGLILIAAFLQFELVQYRRRTGQLPDIFTAS